MIIIHIVFIHHLLCTYRTRTKEGRQPRHPLTYDKKKKRRYFRNLSNGFCDIDAKHNSNGYITEYVLPKPANAFYKEV